MSSNIPAKSFYYIICTMYCTVTSHEGEAVALYNESLFWNHSNHSKEHLLLVAGIE